jgi:hypothetical protein
MVETGFCQRAFCQTNEHQCYLNKKLISELHGEVESPQTRKKILFFIPLPERNFISGFELRAFLSTACEHDLQSFTFARWRDLLPYIVNYRNGKETFFKAPLPIQFI